MASDINKHLERARRYLEKSKLREAAEEYQAVLAEVPAHQEALQALADLYTRLNDPARAAQYYTAQFDRLLDAGDAAKAAAIFTRFLRAFPQPPERLMRYGALLQKQNRTPEAIEQFSTAVELFAQQQKENEALACSEALARLDPENCSRYVTLGEMAERLGRTDVAAQSYLRAGQLLQAAAALDGALDYLGRAHRLLPADRTSALLLAEAKLRKRDFLGAVATLEPLASAEKDPAFLALFGETLLQTGRLDQARDVFETFYKEKPGAFPKLFEVAGAYVGATEDAKASALLRQLTERMRSARKETELMAEIDRLAAAHPASLPLAETSAQIYEQMNRESKYFDALVRLFDLYFAAGRVKEACETLDRLVDIDPYDFRNQERIAKLQGKADSSFLQNILSRAAKAATVSSRAEGFTAIGEAGAATSSPISEEARTQQALDDLLVQVEIFLQYSLQAKAIERLERIAELFPGAESTNGRLQSLYQRANWWPKGAPPAPAQPAAPPPATESAPSPVPAVSSAETHRDLAAIAEINRMMYRQPTPREILATTAAEIGKHLRLTRCLVTIGAADDATQLTAEYFTPDVAAVGAAISSVMALVSAAGPDALGGIDMQASRIPGLREFGLESALAVALTDKETQAAPGILLVGDAAARKWKPNENFFLQAVGDQLVLSVNHARLRSLVRSMAVADEKTGLLGRGGYIDCLLAESSRARAQGTPISLIVLQIDRGGELLRQHGDAAVDQYVEQLARALSTAVRQTDITVKYTAWSLVFILPDTPLPNARTLAEKLRQLTGTVVPPWGTQDITVSAVVAQASTRPGDETEDRVTEWINRAETGMDEARQRGGNLLMPLATP
jgi:diguanylate cyclase (GGDEF)-like protein